EGHFGTDTIVPAVHPGTLDGDAGHAEILQRCSFVFDNYRRNRIAEKLLRPEPFGPVEHPATFGTGQLFIGAYHWPHPIYSNVYPHCTIRISGPPRITNPNK